MLSEEGGRHSNPFALVQLWQQTPDARGYLNSLLKRNKRKCFGFLESPYDSERRDLPVLHKKLFLAGKSSVGKTSTIDKLAGRDMKESHEETAGIQTHTLYWPVKLMSPSIVIVVQLELWDTGEKALQKFDHILPACLKSTDGTLFFFSYEDRKSWEGLARLMSALSRKRGSDLKLVVGTHSDSLHREVTAAEVEEFQRITNLVVLPITNTNGPRIASDPGLPDGREGIKEITPFMNTLAHALLVHEQKIGSEFARSLGGGTSPSTSSPESNTLPH